MRVRVPRFLWFLSLILALGVWLGRPGVSEEARTRNRAPVASFLAQSAAAAKALVALNRAPIPSIDITPRAVEIEKSSRSEATEKSSRPRTSTPVKSRATRPARTTVHKEAKLARLPTPPLTSTPRGLGRTRANGAPSSIQVDSFNIPESSLTKEELDKVLAPLTATKLTLEGLKSGVRELLQKAYGAKGIQGVQILIPPQTIENRSLLVKVLEPKLGELVIEGARCFSAKSIGRFFNGKITNGNGVLVVEKLERQLRKANRHPDRKVVAVLKSSETEGATDVAFHVKERETVHGIAPLHYTVGVNNTGSPSTGRNRVFHALQYTDLWDKEHIVGLQWQFSPTDFSKVQALAGSYRVPLGTTGHALNFYGGYSDVETRAVLDSLELFGNSASFGAQLDLAMPQFSGIDSSLTIGAEWTRLENSLEFGGETALKSELGLLPITGRYTFHKADQSGLTSGQLSFRYNLPGLASDGDTENFNTFRPGASRGFLKTRFGLDRIQRLPAGWGLSLKAEGQYTLDDLVPAEQFHLGGQSTVRGYEQSEVSGDRALLARAELLSPAIPSVLSRLTSADDRMQIAGFVDYGMAFTEDPDGTSNSEKLGGAGVGLRYFFSKAFEGRLDFAWALQDGPQTECGDLFIHFGAQLSF